MPKKKKKMWPQEWVKNSRKSYTKTIKKLNQGKKRAAIFFFFFSKKEKQAALELRNRPRRSQKISTNFEKHNENLKTTDEKSKCVGVTFQWLNTPRTQIKRWKFLYSSMVNIIYVYNIVRDSFWIGLRSKNWTAKCFCRENREREEREELRGKSGRKEENMCFLVTVV